MPDFNNGKIYVIKNRFNDFVYVGSTTLRLNERFNCHKTDKDCSLYKYVSSEFNNDWDGFYIELLEEIPCSDKKELIQKENEYFKTFSGVINKNNPIGLNSKDYYQKNKEHKLHYQKQYYSNKKLKNIIYLFLILFIHHIIRFFLD